MRKLLNFSVIACITCANVYGQNSDSASYHHYQKVVNNILNMQTGATASKTTAVADRLIRSYDVITSTTGTASNDSFLFKYTGSKGSEFDFNEVIYHQLVDIQNDFLNQPAYNMPDIRADSSWHYRKNTGPGSFYLKTIQENKYNNMGFIEDCMQYLVTQPANNVRNQYIYNTQLKTGELKMYTWDMSINQWKTGNMRRIKYDAQNRVLTDSLFTPNSSNGYDPVSAYMYEYDNAGNITKIMQDLVFSNNNWYDVKEYLFTYYPGNQLKTSAYSSNPTQMGWTLVARDSFGYQPGIDFYTSRYQGVNTFDQGHFKFLNSQNLPDSISYVSIQNGLPTEIKRRIISYNSNNNPVLSVFYDFTAPLLIDRKTHYEYETYDPLSIANALNGNADIMSVYPNPANNYINLEFAPGMLNQTVSIIILNAAGQIILSETFNIKQFKEQINLQDLPSGTYFVLLGNKNYNQLLQQM